MFATADCHPRLSDTKSREGKGTQESERTYCLLNAGFPSLAQTRFVLAGNDTVGIG